MALDKATYETILQDSPGILIAKQTASNVEKYVFMTKTGFLIINRDKDQVEYDKFLNDFYIRTAIFEYKSHEDFYCSMIYGYIAGMYNDAGDAYTQFEKSVTSIPLGGTYYLTHHDGILEQQFNLEKVPLKSRGRIVEEFGVPMYKHFPEFKEYITGRLIARALALLPESKFVQKPTEEVPTKPVNESLEKLDVVIEIVDELADEDFNEDIDIIDIKDILGKTISNRGHDLGHCTGYPYIAETHSGNYCYIPYINVFGAKMSEPLKEVDIDGISDEVKENTIKMLFSINGVKE